MKAVSKSTRCIAIDLPGHGGSKLQYSGGKHSDRPNLSVDVMSEILNKVLNNLTSGKVTLVGYSMGARISLYTALKSSDKVLKTHPQESLFMIPFSWSMTLNLSYYVNKGRTSHDNLRKPRIGRQRGEENPKDKRRLQSKHTRLKRLGILPRRMVFWRTLG